MDGHGQKIAYQTFKLNTRRNIRTNKFGFEIISTIGAVLWQN